MLLGSQPALSVYRTLKRIDVDVDPVPGEAPPDDSVITCEAPLQLAARTGDAVGSSTTQIARRARARVALITTRVGCVERNVASAPGFAA